MTSCLHVNYTTYIITYGNQSVLQQEALIIACIIIISYTQYKSKCQCVNWRRLLLHNWTRLPAIIFYRKLQFLMMFGVREGRSFFTPWPCKWPEQPLCNTRLSPLGESWPLRLASNESRPNKTGIFTLETFTRFFGIDTRLHSSTFRKGLKSCWCL